MGHTPGPWTIGDVQWIMHQKSGMGYSYRPITAGSWELATVWEDDGDREMEANVHLIATAPELLAALKEIVAYDEGSNDPEDYGCEVLLRCKAAIAKAEGRSE